MTNLRESFTKRSNPLISGIFCCLWASSRLFSRSAKALRTNELGSLHSSKPAIATGSLIGFMQSRFNFNASSSAPAPCPITNALASSQYFALNTMIPLKMDLVWIALADAAAESCQKPRKKAFYGMLR